MSDVMAVSNEKFVELWIKAYKKQIGLKGLVQQQDWVYVTASARASSLRRAGVKLPTMRSPKQVNNSLVINPKVLNDMIVKELGEEALTWRNR